MSFSTDKIVRCVLEELDPGAPWTHIFLEAISSAMDEQTHLQRATSLSRFHTNYSSSRHLGYDMTVVIGTLRYPPCEHAMSMLYTFMQY